MLISWVAVNNDPYERDGMGEFRKLNGSYMSGPTLTLLEDDRSPYAGKVQTVVLLHASGKSNEKSRCAFIELKEAIARSHKTTSVIDESWSGNDPTDHKSIFSFIQKKLPALREKFPRQHLLIHISPGTPAMQTIWLLAGEMGLIDPPYTLVKSYRKRDRESGDLVVPVSIGIDSLYKALKESSPGGLLDHDEVRILTDPAKLQSDKLKQVYELARIYARLNVPVLIRGERGTGKTSLANWMRINSTFRIKAKDRSWPSIACGQYSEETMRSELFGYKEGAFTGASEDKSGLLAEADGDTLFLDEIGDISKSLQRLLIKTIEEKQFYPLGAKTPEKSHFRLISATNISEAMLHERIDPDFLDRIRALEILLPPLRDTPEDLPWIWRSVFKEALKRAGIAPETIPISEAFHVAVTKRLNKLPLEGNIRDLFIIAYPMIAILYDQPDAKDDAIEFGFESLIARQEGHSNMPSDLVGCVVSSFLSGDSLHPLLRKGSRIETEQVLSQLKRYIADELLSLKGFDLSEISDVTERTLRNWKNK